LGKTRGKESKVIAKLGEGGVGRSQLFELHHNQKIYLKKNPKKRRRMGEKIGPKTI
jgi:hypothetical protein